jgi:hypothetical protein
MIHALIIDGQNNHDWQQTTRAIQQALTDNFRVALATVTEPATFTADFSHYDVVISTGPMQLNLRRVGRDRRSRRDSPRTRRARRSRPTAHRVVRRIRVGGDCTGSHPHCRSAIPTTNQLHRSGSNYFGPDWPEATIAGLEEYVRRGGGGPKGGGHAIGYAHAEALRSNPRTTLALGADINAENLAFFRQKFAVPAGFADYREMLRVAQPEIVSICTYVGLHRQMVEDCARAGVKGIYLEKPIVSSPADLVAVDKVVQETGVKIVVAHIRRYLPAFMRLRELYSNGTVGEPLLDGGRTMAGPWAMTLVGTAGTLRLQHEHLAVVENANGRSVEDYAQARANGHSRIWSHIVTELVN